MVICENCIFVNDSSRAVHAVPYAVHAVLKHPLAMKIPGRALSLSNLPVCCCSSLCLDKFGRAAAAERNVENRITETVVWSVSLTFLCFHLCSGIPGGFFFYYHRVGSGPPPTEIGWTRGISQRMVEPASEVACPLRCQPSPSPPSGTTYAAVRHRLRCCTAVPPRVVRPGFGYVRRPTFPAVTPP